MLTLNDACHELRLVLAQIEGECQDTRDHLNEFEKYAGSYAINRLIRKLAILSYWIIGKTKRQYEEHRGHGYVCVFLTERDGITVYWVEDEKIVADKSWFASFGSTVLSVEEAIDIICQLIKELGSNNWPRVIDWLSKYGKSPGLNFDKLP